MPFVFECSHHYLSMWERFSDFAGRATRAEYWYAFLLHFIISSLLGVLAQSGGYFAILSGMYTAAGLVPMSALLVRRLHDVGQPGPLWLGAILLTLFLCVSLMVGAMTFSPTLMIAGVVFGLAAFALNIYIFTQLVRRGSAGPNRYGPDPCDVKAILPVQNGNQNG